MFNMAITIDDINLKKFLEKIAPEAFPEPGKLTLPNKDFLFIASLLKLELQIQRLVRK